LSRVNRNIWVEKPYIYKSTSNGIDVYDLISKSIVNSIPIIGGANSVWADSEYVYVATSASGIYRFNTSSVSGTANLSSYKSYPDITSNVVYYTHGAGDFLCAVTESGVDRYNTSTDSRDYLIVDNAEKCFQTSNGRFYFYENPFFDVCDLGHNFINWKCSKEILFDNDVEHNKIIFIEIPNESPYDIQIYTNELNVECSFLSFNGSNGITVNNFWSSAFSGKYNGLNFQGNCTVMAWVNPTNVSSTKRYLFSDGNGDEGELSFYNNRIYCRWGITTNIITHYIDISINQWYHIALCHRNDTISNTYILSLYINGVLVQESSVDVSSVPTSYGPEAALRIGSNFIGYIYMFKCFDRVLTNEDIIRSSLHVNDYDSDLVLYLKLTDGTGNVAYDSKNMFNGTITSPLWQSTQYKLPNLYFIDEYGNDISYLPIINYSIGSNTVVALTLDNEVNKVYIMYGNDYFNSHYEVHLVMNSFPESIINLEYKPYNFSEGKPFDSVFSNGRLCSVSSDMVLYEYKLNKGSKIKSYSINDIYVTENTSRHKPGNVIFLATSWGAYMIGEKLGDESNCDIRVYLINS